MELESSDEEENELLRKAKLLIELRDYQVEDLDRGEMETAISVSKQSTNEKVLIHIVKKSNLKSNGVSIDKAQKILEQGDSDNIIIFGKRFTEAAGRCLKEHGVEYFSMKRKVVSTLNSLELNKKITKCVDTLCQIKCGQVPESNADCKGFSENSIKCTFCDGTGILNGPFIGLKCSSCGGTGIKDQHYSCKVRLISDNADFHLENNWIVLLQNDLLTLLEMLRVSKAEQEGDLKAPPHISTELSGKNE